MKILVSGASGLIGSAVCQALEKEGYTVKRLVRSKNLVDQDHIFWDPQEGILKSGEIEGCDVVINLAGENIASGRWTERKKQAILESRVKGTKLLADTVNQLQNPPRLFINGSAIGYYGGDRQDTLVDEKIGAGVGFLSEVCQKWERAAKTSTKTPVIILRFGVVLSTEGGALKQMLLPFKLGVGGVVGSGKQYMSWVHIDDVVGIILFLIKKGSFDANVLNVVAPDPVTNREFTKTLGKTLNRPTIFPLPSFVVKILFGEMGEELLLKGKRVSSRKVQELGYTFSYPHLEEALCSMI